MLCETPSRETTTTLSPEISPTTASYLATKASDLRREYDPANLGGRFSTVQPASAPTPDVDEVAKAFEFLALDRLPQPRVFLAGSSCATGQLATDFFRNELALITGKQLFISYEYSYYPRAEAWLDSAFSGLAAKCAERGRQYYTIAWQPSLPPKRVQRAAKAPAWLVQRMKALRQMPPPTLEEVDTQLKASAEVRKKLTDRLPVSVSGQSKGKRF